MPPFSTKAPPLPEAASLAHAAATDKKRKTLWLTPGLHPSTISVVTTRAEVLGWKIVTSPTFPQAEADHLFAGILAYPESDGRLPDPRSLIQELKKAGALSILVADPLALLLFTPPGELGADVAVGSTQRFGVPIGFGGPHAAYFATKLTHQRLLPGRLIGVSKDSAGRTAYRLSLQTREQHIRRDRATSNICTAQALLATLGLDVCHPSRPERPSPNRSADPSAHPTLGRWSQNSWSDHRPIRPISIPSAFKAPPQH